MKIDDEKLQECASVSFYGSTQNYQAYLGSFVGTGKTRQEALDKLKESILRNLRTIHQVLSE